MDRVHVLMQEIYDEFDRQNKDIVIAFQPSSEASIAVAKANDLLALDEMPNIVSTNGTSYFLENAIKRGKALDLMPYINKDEELKNAIHPSVFEQWKTADECLYTIPDALEVMGFWYNESYFIEAGITDSNGNAALPKTWDEFYEVCEKLLKWNESSKKLKSVYALENTQIIENLLLARLAGESKQGLSMAIHMPTNFDTHCFRTVVADFANIFYYSADADSLNDARQYFIEGATAMYFNGVWESEVIQNSEVSEQISYSNYPTNYGEELAYISPSSGYVFYHSPNEKENEAAVRFLKYMLSQDVQTRIGAETGQAPSNPHVDNDQICVQYPLLGKALECAHQAQIQIPTITSVWDNEAIQIISNDLKNASHSEETMDKMIKKLKNL